MEKYIVEQCVKRLLYDNQSNLENDNGGYDCGYAEGYHDALVDVMNQLRIEHGEEYFN